MAKHPVGSVSMSADSSVSSFSVVFEMAKSIVNCCFANLMNIQIVITVIFQIVLFPKLVCFFFLSEFV